MIQVQQTQQLQQQQMDALGAQQQQTATDGGLIHQQQQQTPEQQQQQQQRMNQQPTSPPPQWSNFKAKEPPVFHGDRKLLKGWVTDMREYIQLSDIQVSKQLGSVYQYFSRFLKQWYDKTQRSASPFVNVEDLFTCLSERFPDSNKQIDLRGEVRNVHCQGNEGVHKYSVRFNDIAEGIVDVSEIDLMYDYIRGLLDEVRKEVRRRKPDSLDAVMKDAEEAKQLLSGGRKKDYRGQSRDRRSDSHPPLRPQSQSNDGPVPMDLNRISQIYSLSQDEIKRHI
uniref:Retrotransposon gag domain-containing protein n=1 Tax=Chromera velia CCMP2878 TaxID=1169474 RepID=A0A0G4HAC6_9ALVE|eukprot:Cvel_25632.t1-p1 / transcript=Cvel_25632.t1 / gene=Cvel_25632 / organism=Chromera_velia_CCMP2878 / gene_product=hypothetical protein / transcript_product=hypothetical protein / location=Cvel_scaffold2931:17593-18432(+) / protein_length=280 / sequence_SO=supercontig / SO=protein_coding / is_pseudo=false